MRARPVVHVARRELRENMRSRSFRISTAVLVVAALAAVIVPSFFDGGDPDPLRVAVADERAAVQGDRPVEVGARTPEEARAAVEADAADVALVGPGPDGATRVVAREELDDNENALLAAAVADARLRAALGDAGLAPAAVDDILAASPLQVTVLDPSPADAGASFIAFVSVLLLVLALVLSGTIVASGVAEEKATRISEILLAAMRPSELLTGKVVGIGLLALGQLTVVIVPAVVAVLVLDVVDLPDAAPTALAASILWFLLGYALYSVSFGALGALVARQQEVGMAVAPLSYVLWGGYIVGVVGVDSADSTWFQALSLVPLLSPLLMPVRMVTDTVSPAEVALAVVLTVATAVLLTWVGGRIYRAGLVAGGPRIPFVAALRRALPGA